MQALHSPEQAADWLRQRVTGDLRTDSRQVQKGDAFIAWPGAATDGRQYLAAATAQGATACLLEASGWQAWQDAHALATQEGAPSSEVTSNWATYAGLKADTGWIANAYYVQPSQALKVLAVTGTNGKTSTTWWLAQALNALAVKPGAAAAAVCAVVGTLGVGQPPLLVATGMTTPDPVVLHAQFRKWLDQGFEYCAIEASSIGVTEQRLAGTHIHLAVFTNFTQDHLDYHGSMQAYWQAKAALFDWPGLTAVVLNVDDVRGLELAERAEKQGLSVWTCSSQNKTARLRAQNIQRHSMGLAFEVVEGAQQLALQTTLMGEYNVDNLLGVMAALRALDFDLASAVAVCAHLSAVPGRMEKITAGCDVATEKSLPLTVVDYAHTPDAVAQSLAALRPLVQAHNAQLWCVLGCGGDSDSSKRPLMAQAAQAGADRLIFTSDNPRSESPAHILNDMLCGLQHPQAVHAELDRAQAIGYAVREAAAQDVILIAGKGHEATQEIEGMQYPFDDRVQARMALLARAGVGA